MSPARAASTRKGFALWSRERTLEQWEALDLEARSLGKPAAKPGAKPLKAVFLSDNAAFMAGAGDELSFGETFPASSRTFPPRATRRS